MFSMASPSSTPTRSHHCATRSTRRSAADRLRGRGRTGSSRSRPVARRPRSWLSMRRLSWRSVPMMWRPPASTTSSSRSRAHCGLELGQHFRVLRRVLVVPALGQGQELGVAAEHDVGAAARHVGRDRDGAEAPAWATISASRSCCLALSTLCLHALLLELLREHLRGLDRDRADENRLASLVALLDLVDDGVELLALRLEDDVG